MAWLITSKFHFFQAVDGDVEVQINVDSVADEDSIVDAVIW